MSRQIIAPIAAGVLLAMAGAAQAATKTTTFQVSATVSENCVINATNLNLGTFDGTNTLDTASSTITVRCTDGTDFLVGLDDGLTGTFANRVLTGPGSDTLLYNLYTDAARTAVWNDSSNRGSGIGGGMSSPVTLNVYGKLDASLNTGPVEAGEYTDTITATITY